MGIAGKTVRRHATASVDPGLDSEDGEDQLTEAFIAPVGERMSGSHRTEGDGAAVRSRDELSPGTPDYVDVTVGLLRRGVRSLHLLPPGGRSADFREAGGSAERGCHDKGSVPRSALC